MKHYLRRFLVLLMAFMMVVSSQANANELGNENSIKTLSVKQQKKYDSPDGKWSTKMYYMDGYVNGVRKLWPMNSEQNSSDFWNNGENGRSIDIVLDPERYMPLDSSYVGIKFKLSVEEPAKAGVTYTKDNFGLIKYDFIGDKLVDLTHSGEINLEVDAKHEFYDSDDAVASFNTEHEAYFKDVAVRLDILDRDAGIVVGYLKFSTTDKDGNNVDVEGYFAEKYKDNSDRPSISDLCKNSNPSNENNSGKDDSNKKESNKNGTTNKTDKNKSGKDKSSKDKSGKNKKGKNNSGKNDSDTGNSGNNKSDSSKIPSTTKVPSLVWEKCTNCNGTGKLTCPICKGKGYREYMGYSYGQYGNIKELCICCGGVGYTYCTVCGGNGEVMRTK